MILRSRFFLAACALASAATSAHAQRYLRTAEKQFELAEYAAAAEGLARYVEKEPAAAAERARLAYALRLTNRPEAAAAEYAELAGPEQDNPDYIYQYGLALLEQGAYEEAGVQFLQAERLGHPDAAAAGAQATYALERPAGRSPGAWRVTNEFVNGGSDDFGATAFGEYIVFASGRDGGAPKLQLSSRDENDFLRVPRPLHKLLTDETGDAPVAYSPSGDLIAYTRNNFAEGERFLPEAGWELSLVMSTGGADGDFQQGKPFVHNGPGFSTGFAAFSPDGERLYFASDRPGGFGGFDLYYSARTASGWATPVNLGPEVNSPGNEVTPSVTDGAIYFASDYLPGYGGMDVFRADAMGDVLTGVVNLGPAVNSPRDDAGFTFDAAGRYGYFYSNRPGGKGGLDLYRAVREGKSLTIAVLDAATGAPVPNALLDFSTCREGNFLTGIDGEYVFRAIPALDCRPTVRKSGYDAQEFEIAAQQLGERDRLELRLEAEDELRSYAGRVVHSRTNEPLVGVAVAAQSKDGAFSTTEVSDADGEYTLRLAPDAEYRLTYRADGMADLDREVSTSAASGPVTLGTFALFPAPAETLVVGSATASAQDGSAAGQDTASEGGEPSPQPAVSALELAGGPGADSVSAVNVVLAPAEFELDPEGTAPPSTGTVGEGFAVQVAALLESATDISEYETRLGRIGEVYGKREAGVLRVRVGPTSRPRALALLEQVRRMGFDDAFLAREEGGAALGLDHAADPRDTVARQEPPAEAQRGGYLIRLASYTNFSNFQPQRVAGLGTVVSRELGDYVVALLGGFPTEDAAEAQLEAARAAGFGDAHVVFEGSDGSLRRVD